jgi:MscS family membrane protein
MPLLLESIKNLLQAHTQLIHPLSVLGVAMLLTYACYLFYQKIHPVLARRKYFITSTLLEAIHWPLVVFIWVRTASSVIDVFTLKMDEAFVHLVWKLCDIGRILLLAWVFMRFIQRVEKQLLLGHLTKKRPDETTVQAAGKLLRMAAVIIVMLSSLPVLGIPVSGIVAFSGGSVIVVGIGAQQILADYFGGIVIYADRHFKVGDWISSPDKEIEGQVEYIGWRTTQIRTFDQKVCYIPNAALSSIIVVNASRMKNRCIKAMIGIRYTDATVLDKITREIRTILQEHPGIDQRRLSLAHFTEFGPSSLNINIYAFTKTIDRKTYHDVQQDVFLRVIQIVENNDASLALPTRMVYTCLQERPHPQKLG